MKIVVNHLTRMKGDRICVAGIDQASGKHVRPVAGRLTTALLSRSGGPFGIAAVVDLGPVKANGAPPEVEDHLFNPGSAKVTGALSAKQYWKLLEQTSEPSLTRIFGKDLMINGRTMALDIGRGKASLGCLAPAHQPSIGIDGWDKVRLSLREGAHSLAVAVTDVRLYEKGVPRRKTVEELSERLKEGTRVILSVGLGRSYQKPGDSKERHWLQINNIHLEDDPTWSS